MVLKRVWSDEVSLTSNETKNRPYCGEKIQSNAKKCRYCHEFLNEPEEVKTPTREQSSKTQMLTCEDRVKKEGDHIPWSFVWRRRRASCMDFTIYYVLTLIFFVILWMVIYTFDPQSTFFDDISEWTDLFMTNIVLIIITFIVETVCINLWGNTPWKKIAWIKIMNLWGNKLSLSQSFYRSLNKRVRGDWRWLFGLYIAGFITHIYQYNKVKNEETHYNATYDIGKHKVVYRKKWWVGYVICVILAIIICAIIRWRSSS
jgi:uncharacterized RDD family membrane protein YckC